MKLGFLFILVPVLLGFTFVVEAAPRTSTDYTLTPESLNGGGQRTSSASYANEGSIGEFGGLSSADAPSIASTSGYIGALEIVGVVPTVTTLPATGVTSTGASLDGEVMTDGGSEVIVQGFVWATDPDPTVEVDTAVTAAPGSGLFIVALTVPSPGTTYHVRAFATTMIGTGYGANVYFTTDTDVDFLGDLAGFSRTILASDRHVFAFTLTGPRIVSFTTTGGATLRAGLFDGMGDLVAFFDGDSDIDLETLLLAGDYTLHIYREPGPGAAQAFDLQIDASVVAASRPDVAVGASSGALRGVGAYAPTPQMASLISRRARPLTGHASVANRGKLPDALAVNATRGNVFFKVAYLGPTGNITAGLVSGAFRTAATDEGDTPVAIRASITPNKRKLTKRRGKRRVILRRVFTVSITVRSTVDAGVNDSGVIRVQTR